MEDNSVTIARVKYTNVYPSSFMLIATMNPCSCGYYGQKRCHCTDYEVLKYRQKISGPMLDTNGHTKILVRRGSTAGLQGIANSA